jgi:hypothetical protein
MPDIGRLLLNKNMRRQISIFTCSCLLGYAVSVEASGDLAQQMQAIQQKKQAMQQQAIAQKQQEMIQQRQQQIMQQQAVVQQQRMAQNQAMQQRAMQQRALQEQQQRVLQQKQMMGQAMQQKALQDQALQHQMAEQQVYQDVLRQQAQQEAAGRSGVLSTDDAMSNIPQNTYAPSQEEPAEISNMESIWKDMETSSEIWPQIIDPEPKELTIQRYIESYQAKGIMIRKPAQHYIAIIDSMMNANPNLSKTPFKDVLKLAAIVEYDFDNGQDKDQLIVRILGQQGYESNKKRLGK